MFILGDKCLQDSACEKMLTSPELLQGYLGGKYKSITLQQAKKIVEKRKNDLYTAICNLWYGGEIELSFVNKESMDWWETFVDNIKVVQESVNCYAIFIPRPPHYIFEKT